MQFHLTAVNLESRSQHGHGGIESLGFLVVVGGRVDPAQRPIVDAVDGAVGGEYQPVRHERQQFSGMGAAQHARDIAEIGDTDDDGAAARGCGPVRETSGHWAGRFRYRMARLARGMEGGVDQHGQPPVSRASKAGPTEEPPSPDTLVAIGKDQQRHD
jgi:hypothetical protein